MENCCAQCDVDLDTVDEIEIYVKGDEEETVCGDCNSEFDLSYLSDGWSVLDEE